MSLIPPIEQTTAELLCGIIIPEGQGGDPVKITNRAKSALVAAGVLTQIATGNASAGLAQITAALGSTDLDPAILLAIQNMVTLGFQQVALLNQIGSVIPIFGASVSGILSNIAAGVTAAANAEIAKYAPENQKAPA